MSKYLLPIAFAAALMSCDNMNKPATALNEPSEATEDTAVVYPTQETAVDVAGRETVADVEPLDAWDVDVDMPVVSYPEITEPKVEVRGNDRYVLYSAEEVVFFNTDKAELLPRGKEVLQQITNSINKRNGTAQVRVVGHTDARASKDYNKELGRERAEAVQNWMVQNGNIDASRVKVMSMGEKNPVATNATPTGRQLNRRVEIVVQANAGAASAQPAIDNATRQ